MVKLIRKIKFLSKFKPKYRSPRSGRRTAAFAVEEVPYGTSYLPYGRVPKAKVSYGTSPVPCGTVFWKGRKLFVLGPKFDL